MITRARECVCIVCKFSVSLFIQALTLAVFLSGMNPMTISRNCTWLFNGLPLMVAYGIVALVRVRVPVRYRTGCAHRRTGFWPGAAQKVKKA